jgi:hypothetical protein
MWKPKTTATRRDALHGGPFLLAAAAAQSRRRAAFIERYLIAVAQGGKVASAEFDIPHAGNLFDVLYPAEKA